MIEIGPIYDYIVEIAAAVLTAAGVYVARKIGKRFDWFDSDDAADTVDRYVSMGIDAVRGWLGEEIDVSDNESVEQIVQWVVDHAPKAMKTAGLSADDVRNMVKSYLQDGND